MEAPRNGNINSVEEYTRDGYGALSNDCGEAVSYQNEDLNKSYIEESSFKIIENYSMESREAQSLLEKKVVEEGDINSFWSMFNLWNDIAGPGIVSMPFYVFSIGIWASPFVLLFFALINSFTLNALYTLSKKYRQKSYPDLCQFTLGTWGYVLMILFIFAFNFGGFCGALLILGAYVPSVFDTLIGGNQWWFTRRWTLVFCVLLFLPFSFFKNISNYRVNSFLAMLSIVLLSLVFLVYAIIAHSQYPIQENSLIQHMPNLSLLSSLGGLSYLFVCHDLSFNVFMSFKNASRARWALVTYWTMFLSFTVFLITGVTGYLMFYQNVHSNVLDNFSNDNIVAVFLRVIVIINILISVPYYCFMPKLALQFFVELLFGKITSQRKDMILNPLLTVIVLGSGFLIAEIVTDLGDLYSLIGGLAAAGMAYVLPPIIFLKLEAGVLYSPKKLVHQFILVFGLITMIGSTTMSLIQLAT